MFNRSHLMEAATRGVDFLKPAKWLANGRIVLFHQAHGGVLQPGWSWRELSMQFKK